MLFPLVGLIPLLLYSDLSLTIVFCLKLILPDTIIAISAFFCFSFAWNIFFHPLFSVSLCEKLVRQHIVRCLFVFFFFSINSAIVCFDCRIYLFTFKVIIDKYGLTAIFKIVFLLFRNSIVTFFFSYSLFGIYDFLIVVCLDSFLCIFALFTIGFCYMVTIRIM